MWHLLLTGHLPTLAHSRSQAGYPEFQNPKIWSSLKQKKPGLMILEIEIRIIPDSHDTRAYFGEYESSLIIKVKGHWFRWSRRAAWYQDFAQLCQILCKSHFLLNHSCYVAQLLFMLIHLDPYVCPNFVSWWTGPERNWPWHTCPCGES